MAKGTSKRRTYRCGVIGYGGAFNMGWTHLSMMSANPRMEVAAVCELDRKRLEVAAEDWPQAALYSRVGDMLRFANLDIVAVITPHNTHAKLVLQCLDAKVNTVTEKPMAITSAECKSMLAMARRRRVMLSTFHNRRWDPDFLLLKDLVRKERVVGRVFRVECGFHRWGKQGDWWRSDRKISGGNAYDWGAHFCDWVLQLVSDDIEWVSGFQAKNRQWKGYTNEDHSEVSVKFKKGCEATVTISGMSMAPRPQWRILGDRGSIESWDRQTYAINSLVNDRPMSAEVSSNAPNHSAETYYRNVCRHIQGRGRLSVTPESSARVIGVLEAANQSAARGSQPIRPVFR